MEADCELWRLHGRPHSLQNGDETPSDCKLLAVSCLLVERIFAEDGLLYEGLTATRMERGRDPLNGQSASTRCLRSNQEILIVFRQSQIGLQLRIEYRRLFFLFIY